MQGWIKLHRKITENELWQERPFSRGQAWVDLLLMANSTEGDVLCGNTIINLDRGQLHTSELKLMKRWGWSKKKVRAYLALLKTLKMATAEGTIRGTTITIENYNDYQDRRTDLDTEQGTFKEPRRNREGTAKDTLTRSKEEKERKEVKEDKNINPPYPLTGFGFSEPLEIKIHEWLTYKTEKKEPYKPTGFKSLLSAIKKHSEQYGDMAVINLIDECMAANWKGIIWDRIKKPDKSAGTDWLDLKF
jgi:hypothetical protein